MKKAAKRIFSLLLVLAVLVSAGCGSSGTDNADNNNAGSTAGDVGTAPEGDQSKDTSGEGNAMGRYIEKTNTSLTESLDYNHSIVELEDGNLAIVDATAGKWVSEDNGETWQDVTPDGFRKIAADYYVMDESIAPDGTIGLVCIPNTAVEPGADIEFKYFIITPDGSQKELTLPNGEDNSVMGLYFSDDSKLFAAALGGKIYEVNIEDDSYDVFTERDRLVDYLVIKGNRMLCTESKGITILDLETKERIEDKVLDEFITTNLGARIQSSMEATYNLIPILAEDDILYLVFDKGIYRHVIGGSAVEQIVDGGLTSLGNPSNGLSGALLLEDDSFLVLFTSAALSHFTYDSETPTVPGNQLRAYSLVENTTLKQAISIYQLEHPDIQIQYDVGMDANSSGTREDALKKLNTELVAGTGPDIIILDDMPIESYIEKGILLDISPYIKQSKEKGTYFENILNTFQTDNGTYGVPTEFMLPFIMGSKTLIDNITSIEKLADAAEQLRKENPEQNVLGVMPEKDMIKRLLPASAPTFISKDNQLNTEALTEFFTQSKRIWDAERAGWSDADIRQAEAIENDDGSDLTLEEISVYMSAVSNYALDIVADEQKLSVGLSHGSYDFDTTISAFKGDAAKDGTFASYNGQIPNVYVPRSMVGINAKSSNADQAGELLKLMLEDKRVSGFVTYSVNKEVWKESMTQNVDSDGSAYSSMGGSNEEGKEYWMETFQSSEEELGRLEKIADAATTPYLMDTMLEGAVCESGKKIFNGEKTVDEGVAEVKQKLAIYMAE